MATGIFTYIKPKDQIQKNHNREALALLETKKSHFILEIQAAGTGFILHHKLKTNFLDFYKDFVKKNKRENNRSLSAFKKFLRKEKELTEDDSIFIAPPRSLKICANASDNIY